MIGKVIPTIVVAICLWVQYFISTEHYRFEEGESHMVIMIALLWVLATIKWGRWKEWKTYYSTMLFFIAGDFIHAYVSAVKPLWRFSGDPFFGEVTEHLISSLVIFPCTVLLLFSFYPELGSYTKKLFI